MKPYAEMEHHPVAEKLANILCHQTHSNDPHFFRVQVAYFFSMAASMMRTMIKTHDQGALPVNLYAINLAPSGYGKGKSTNIMENQVLNNFRHIYLEQTFPVLVEESLPKIGNRRAARKGTDPDDEVARVEKEFERTGPMLFSFDSGTEPALKQMRHKLLMANAGSMNLQIDEIGSNLLANVDLLNAYLELYDKGYIKNKLVKNTAENTRNEELTGSTPTNMLLFGTPAKLLNGGKTEEELVSMLDTGYARRCFFGYVTDSNKNVSLTPEQLYEQATSQDSHDYLQELSHRFAALADVINVGKELVMDKEVALLIFEYMADCQRRANELPEHREIEKAEMSHRYFKATKLAGAYAFIDESPSITADHVYSAIRLAEDSGQALNRLMHREPPYAKMARYIANVGREVTQHDLVEALPFYKGTASAKNDLLNLAIAYGYQNNIIIKKSFNDGVEFLRGESLEETDLEKMRLSWSKDMTDHYMNEEAPFDKLHLLTNQPDLHWLSHHLTNGHRSADNTRPGFNMVVIDVDGELPIQTARALLKDYKFLLYTTKRSTPDCERYRLIFPTNYVLELDDADYKEFMRGVFDWLPFDVKDTATGYRSKKWLTHQGHYEYNEGQLLDVLPFIPKTSKNEERKAANRELQSLDNLERWVINNTGDGNRNNQLLRYALILVDAGYDFRGIQTKVMDLNDKLADKLDEAEIMGTIMVSVGKRLAAPAA